MDRIHYLKICILPMHSHITFEKRAQVDVSYLFGYLYPDIIVEYHDDAIFFGEDKFPWENDNKEKLKREMDRKGDYRDRLPFLLLSKRAYSLSLISLFKIIYRYILSGHTYRPLHRHGSEGSC